MKYDEILNDLNLPEPGSIRGYSTYHLVKQIITSVWCGANRFEHTEVTRQIEIIRQYRGVERMAGHKSFHKFFGKLNLNKNQQTFTPLYQWFCNKLKFDNFTLDIDSTICTR